MLNFLNWKKNSNNNKIKTLFNSLLPKDACKSHLNIKNQSQPVLLADSDEQITHNIDAFYKKTVLDAMVPRSDIVSVSDKSNLEELSNIIIKHSHTRTLVYKERLDNIIGFIHIKDLFEISAHNKKFVLKKLLRKHIISPHSMKLVDLLIQMQIKRTHIAVIVDEYGGTDGIVTIEDIIEEIVGNIEDEHDIHEDSQDYQLISPGVLLTNSRVEIDTVENIVGVKLKLETEEFDTIGGLVITKIGHVPAQGEIIDLGHNIVAEIIESTPRTIKKIKITYKVQ